MKRPVVAIASVLKPINDSRMYEKFGISLGETNKYDVKIIGFPAKNPDYAPNIDFIPLPPFKRTSWQRLLAPWRILRKLVHLNPDVAILTTHELLPVSLLFHLICRGKLLYDVQENYFLNIATQQIYPKILRYPLACLVRAVEWSTSPMIARYFLAEKIYVNQLPFISSKYQVLENKFQGDLPTQPPVRGHQRLLFTGTIGPHTGIFTAICLAEKLHQADPKITLHIAGFCQHPPTLRKLKDILSDKPYVTTSDLSHPVAHQDILLEIQAADAGILFYDSHPSTLGKIPTKLYEYLALQLPFFMENREEWTMLTDQYPGAITFDISRDSGSELLERWHRTPFYRHTPGVEVTWDTEASLLLKIIKSLIK